MFGLPQMIPVSFFSFGVSGEIDLPWLGAYVVWTLLAALVGSLLGVLLEVRWSHTSASAVEGSQPEPCTGRRALCPRTAIRTGLEAGKGFWNTRKGNNAQVHHA